MASNNVSVAVRIRPKLQKEQIDMCNICTRVSPDEPQVWLGHDKAFTFDYVFDIASQQFDVYDNCVRTLVDGCFDGFNATVLAYGQTGSGKTYTMGTGFDVSCADDHLGIIPRAVSHLFDGIHARKEEAKANGLPLPEFNVTAQFIEIYNEELIDLLCEKRRKGLQIRIHEDQKRGIILTGVENKTVASADDTLACLKSGSLFRTTGATLMNAESSRSHAIFTLFIKQSRVEHVNGIEDPDSDPQQELVTLTAKFNFVDLAGSERLSRTGAVGERAREGISINSGLLHLGNVISALGDRSKKSSHIPYRDSKLTRVLQDSLGGNSVTTMIACISPCDRDFVETLNTLRYANRAKNIKNKVVANQDSQTQLINELRRQLMQLQVENQELKQGKLFVKNDGELELNDVYLEKEMLQRDLNNANIRNKALNTRLEGLTTENISLRGKLAKHQISIGDAGSDGNDSDEDCAGSLIKGYLKEINTLRSKVIESEYTISYYREQLNKQETKELNDQDQPIDIIERAKYEIELGKSRLFQMNSSINSADSNGNRFSEGADIYDTNGDLSGDEDEVQEEFEKKMADQNAEIATLMEIISSKERLIEEAEAREKRIIELTNHYEQKISSFKSKIKQTEDERDTLISKYKRDNKEDHNSKRLKDEFDRRVAQLQSEVRKYESLKREHDKVLRNETSSKEQLKKLRQEIIETKKKRVQLMGQMREQMNRHNKEMQKSKLVINKLTREDYKKDVKIRDLVVQSNQQKKMLQRREEELKVLRRRVKPMSDRVAGRVSHLKRTNLGHTPQKARNMWHNFEQKFNELVMLRISFDKEEKKLERYLAERQNNINIINTLNKEDHVDGDLNTEYLDNLQVNIDYLSKCIEDSQNMIMQIEEDNFNIEQMFDNCDMSEIMYIVNNLANSAIIYAIRASEKDEELKDKDSKLATLWNENAYSNHLLNYMVSKNFDGEENGVYPPGIVNPLVAVDPGLLTPAKSSNDNKFRRLTMTPSELLYQSNDMEAANQTFIAKQLKKVNEDEDYESSINNHNGQPSPISPNGTFIVDKNFDSTYVKEKSDQKVVPNGNLVRQISDRMTQSLHIEPPPPPSVASSNPTNANQHLNVNAQLNRKASLNGATANSGELFRVPSAPSLNDPYAAAAANQYNGTPPGSPSINRRLNRDTNSMASSITQDSDVFSRLTNTSSMTRQPVEYSVGRIEPASSSKGHDKSFPLVCTHTVVGHRRSVLSVTATNEVLFSGSKDGTARIWDLGQGEEVFSLNDHPDSVNVVRYDEYNKLIFTCSKSIIKIWDPRQKPVNCVHTLCASGMMVDNVVSDSFIHDMRLSADGSTLFSATEKLVRIFDLRTFQPIGKLNTGHKSLVTCLAVDNEDLNDTRIVITGSKDHYVKVFELDGEMSGIHTPKITLNPPHFDGIEALRLTDRGQYLFSGGRDGCIRKWDLTRHRMAASLSNCHRDWVLALNTLPQTSILLSACRSGYLRVWNTENCSPFGEIQAHGSAINDIATIPQVAFTASSDCQIHVWQHRETTASTVNDDSA